MPPPVPHKVTLLSIVREWIEALVIAFIVAMFVRTFVVELFRIPSGSMSPTLVGDFAAEVDVDGNGELDQVIVHPDSPLRYQAFYREKGEFRGVDNFSQHGRRMSGVGKVDALTNGQLQLIRAELEPRFDRILVNKFAYWLSNAPDRGDIIVFKVPEPEFKPERPIYIKRVAGVENERVTIGSNGRLIVDGRAVTEPPTQGRLFYNRDGPYFLMHGGAITVPEDHFLAFGDNSYSSSDSRFWGPVPEENLKGKAFLRYWPLKKFTFLE